MAYELPLVRVYQQLEEVSPNLASPDLPALIIGRAYQVLTYADNKSETLVGDYDVTLGNSFNPPSALPGTQLNEDSVKIYMDDMYIEITDGTFDATLNDGTLEDTGTDFTALDIELGDVVYVDHASLSEPVERVVIGIAATVLTLNKNFETSMTGATYSVQKKIDDRLLVSANYSIDGNDIEILPGITHTYNTVSYSVKSGVVYMEYKALRTDLSVDVDDASSVNEIISKIGVISPENPLALGVSLALANTTTAIKFIGVNTDVGDELGWSAVKDIIENDTTVYALSLLTAEASVLGIYKGHVEQMSTADEHGWRIAIGGLKLATSKEIISEKTSGEIYDQGGTFYFRDNTQDFLTDLVSPSDRIEITSPTAVTGSYVVNDVINGNVIEVTTGTPFPSAETGITYTIERDLTKTQQAEEIAATIESYNSKRMVMVWPDEFEANGEIVDGFYAGSVVAGMVAGLPPHQGFTNYGVGGMGRLYHSNTYFNKEQLNTIAGAGGLIFVQSTPTALPYIRHQLTTDMQFVETRELNVVKNFDHLSYYFYGVLEPFIGIYNVTDQNVALIESSIKLAAEAKTKEVLPRIGAPLKSFSIVSVEESSVSSDRVEGKVRLDLPKPLNNIDLFLAI